MRSIGIIGGVGPGATSWLYLEIMKRCVELGVSTYPSIHVYSIPLDRRLERLFVDGTAGPAEERMVISTLAEALRALSDQGVGLILMPCNTLHLYLEQIEQRAGTDAAPLANMVHLASRQLTPGTRTMVLGTATMRDQRLYDRFTPRVSTLVYPAPIQQVAIQELIELCIGDPTLDPWPLLDAVLDEPGPDYDEVLVACTDLCVTGSSAREVRAVGSLQSLATFGVDYILGRVEAEDALPSQSHHAQWDGLHHGR